MCFLWNQLYQSYYINYNESILYTYAVYIGIVTIYTIELEYIPYRELKNYNKLLLFLLLQYIKPFVFKKKTVMHY